MVDQEKANMTNEQYTRGTELYRTYVNSTTENRENAILALVEFIVEILRQRGQGFVIPIKAEDMDMKQINV